MGHSNGWGEGVVQILPPHRVVTADQVRITSNCNTIPRRHALQHAGELEDWLTGRKLMIAHQSLTGSVDGNHLDRRWARALTGHTHGRTNGLKPTPRQRSDASSQQGDHRVQRGSQTPVPRRRKQAKTRRV